MTRKRNPNSLAEIARSLGREYSIVVQASENLCLEYVRPGAPAAYMAAEIATVNSVGGFWVAYAPHVGAYGHQTDRVQRRSGAGATKLEARAEALHATVSRL